MRQQGIILLITETSISTGQESLASKVTESENEDVFEANTSSPKVEPVVVVPLSQVVTETPKPTEIHVEITKLESEENEVQNRCC